MPAGPDAEAGAERVMRRLAAQVDERRNPRTSATVDQLLDRYLENLDGSCGVVELTDLPVGLPAVAIRLHNEMDRDGALTPRHATAPARPLLSKVPAVTLPFWIIKILCTTVSETAAGYLNMSLNLGDTGTSVAVAVAMASAERDAREQRRRAEQETELRAQADAAEDALRELEQVQVETAETIAAVTADTDARVADQTARAEQAVAAETAARAELDRVRAEAAEERAALRHTAHEQGNAVLARFSPTSANEPTETSTPARHG